ncbi:MAG: patatin-like phospholipase family protein [Porticoccaceae bacterium]|nr:patatin-like phospholipase family protein [Porticoccaceae bacterium]
MTAGLILSGGGARAAYQVGVLKALAEILPQRTHNPFPVICGTSAGAINAIALAGRPGPFALRVKKLERIWREINSHQVYRTDFLGVTKNTVKLIGALLHSGYGRKNAVALLNNSPLQELLENYIRFRHIDEAIANRELDAVCITAMHYDSGESVSFFQGSQSNWKRNRRYGIRTGLGIDHLMASTAIPTLFPPSRIGGHYYGDGAVRQLKPLSPALHLGATKLFVIGVSDNSSAEQADVPAAHPPSLGQMISHLLNSAFIDSTESDLETLKSINALAGKISSEERKILGLDHLKPIEYLCISPSRGIDNIAEDYFHELPRSVRMFLHVVGATEEGGGSSAASYLLFEPGFCQQLLKLGYEDAMEQETAIRGFFNLDSKNPE